MTGLGAEKTRGGQGGEKHIENQQNKQKINESIEKERVEQT